MYATDAEGCVQECQALLNEPKLDTAVRTGDVYGLLIEHFAQAKNYKQVCISMALCTRTLSRPMTTIRFFI